MVRALKFTGFFAGVALLVFLLVFGPGYSSFREMFDNREAMAEGSEWVESTYSAGALTDYIAAHPGMVSLARFAVGQPEDEQLYFMADEPRSMGTLSNFFLMAGYAEGFASGSIHPETLLRWGETERFLLPGIGEAVHRQAKRYGESRNWIDDNGRLTLESALRILARHNSPALADHLLLELGETRLQRLYDELALENTDLPVPFSGLLITLAPSVGNEPAERMIGYWQEQGTERLRETAWENGRRFAAGPRRGEWLDILNRERLGASFTGERDLLALYPKTTAREMTRVAGDLLEGRLLSDGAGEILFGWLEENGRSGAMDREFSFYGAMHDNRLGLLNGIDAGVSASTGETIIQAVFFDRMHIAVWFHMSSNHMHQEFQQRLLRDKDLAEAVKNKTGT